MKTRQELIDECRHRVNGLWTDFLYTAPQRGSVDYHYALGRVIRGVEEAVANAINAAVEIVKAQAANGSPLPPPGAKHGKV